MKETDPEILAGELRKGMEVLSELFDFFEQSLSEDVEKLGRGRASAVLMAGIFDNYYTCIETMFFRISQFFENSLSRDRWHADLLNKMSITVKGGRIAVIRDATYECLDELRRFRHFNRYYYTLEYDWDRIDFLVKKIRQVHPLISEDLKRFLDFLAALKR